MRLQRIIELGLIFGLALVLGGCATTGESESAPAEESKAASKEAPAAVPVPASSPLAKIEMGMSDIKVRKLLGEPSDGKSYPTGKNFIPFYFGGDTYRTEMIYMNVGRVVLGNTSRFSRSMVVVDVIHDPSQP
jgi:hypothetical protein